MSREFKLLPLTIGCDPELFVVDIATNKYVSAAGKIKGTKDKPHPIPGGTLQVDGMAAEIGITPAPTCKEFRLGVISTMRTLNRELEVSGCTSVVVPTVKFDQDVWDAEPAASKRLGCDPDYNAYTMRANDPGDGSVAIRHAGGHIHMGWTEKMDVNNPDHIEACVMLAKQMDCLLGLPFLLVDDDVQRRKMYGKAGSIRIKPYGVEYRTLSNLWLIFPDLIDYVFLRSKESFDLLMNGVDIASKYGDEARKLIDSPEIPSTNKVMNLCQVISLEYSLGSLLPPYSMWSAFHKSEYNKSRLSKSKSSGVYSSRNVKVYAQNNF